MPIAHPSKAQIKKARKDANLTQVEAAALVNLGSNARWSEYEQGTRRIGLARWELFLIKTSQAQTAHTPDRSL